MSEIFGEFERIWLVTVPIALLAIFIWGEYRKKRVLAAFIDGRMIPAMVVWRSPTRRRWKIALRVLAAVLIGCALMRPQWGRREVEVVRRGIDIVFAVDTSKSMWARDVQPNRLERVKQDVRYFANDVVDQDRIGLVAFAGTARVLCPLTADRGAFDIFLDELDVGVVSQGGTDIEAALAESVAAFGDDDRNHKAIVLFSDGETHQAIPEELYAEIEKRRIRVYTVGIGNEEGERIPIVDKDGKTNFLKDDNGDIVLTRLDSRTLMQIAQRSLDGTYVHLAAGRRNLANIYRDNIKKIEERELASARQVRKYERFQWFIGAAFVLLALSVFVADGKKSTVAPEGER